MKTPELTHGFEIDIDRCEGTMSCMRACPTHAIRVKDGKARLIPEQCIDCGSCLKVCPTGAISAATLTIADLDRFRFKVAVPAPALFTQFARSDTPELVGQALLLLGFDAVWEYALDIELINRAIRDFVRRWNGPFPLISSSCPVVVRLVQVSYPTMVEQLIPIDAPREIAGREIKRLYSEKLKIPPEEIAAIYITPCQGKSISILQPAEEVKSHLDGTIGISEIYNDILFNIRRLEGIEPGSEGDSEPRKIFRMGYPEGEFHNLSESHYLPLTGLTDIINVFDDIEKGKIRNIEFLECHACPGGCIGGNLTVENMYVARAKKLNLIASIPVPTKEYLLEVERRYALEDFSLRAPLNPRSLEDGKLDLHERVRRKKKSNELMNALPGLNCGLCGAPMCRDHAEDVAAGIADLKECVFISKDRIQNLKKHYYR